MLEGRDLIIPDQVISAVVDLMGLSTFERSHGSFTIKVFQNVTVVRER